MARRDPVDSVLDYNALTAHLYGSVQSSKPHDPIFNPHRDQVTAGVPSTYHPDQVDNDFKPASGDGK